METNNQQFMLTDGINQLKIQVGELIYSVILDIK